MSESASFGNWGENLAEDFLKKLGWKIAARDYRLACGEIDVIALDGKTLVFVEVKARTNFSFGGPAAAVTKSKQRKLTAAALGYIKETGSRPDSIRFDVIAIVAGKEPLHIKNAFTPERFSY